MPKQATPPEDLNTLLACPAGQFVDVIAFVTNMTERSQKTTKFGLRDLVNITILDDSGANRAAQSTFTAWFPIPSSGEPCDDLKKLTTALTERVPVAFVNLICQRASGTTTAKPF